MITCSLKIQECLIQFQSYYNKCENVQIFAGLP